jgi:hypothetical protein
VWSTAEEYRRLLASEGFEVIRVSPVASFDLVAMEAIWSGTRTEPRKRQVAAGRAEIVREVQKNTRFLYL